MKGVPKIVRQRLQVAHETSAQMSLPHPDATLLAAFAEQSLPRRERVAVFDHLAQCADCRDVIFLAAPQFDTPLNRSKISARPGWLRLPILRWGVLGACVLVVVALGLRYEAEKSPASSPQVEARMISKAIAPPVREQGADMLSQLKTTEPKRAQHKTSETNSPRLQVPRSRANGPLAEPVVPERHAASAVPKFPMQFDGPQGAIRRLPLAGRATTSTVAGLQSLASARAAKNGNQALDEDGKKAQDEGRDGNLAEFSQAQSSVSPVGGPTSAEPLSATGQNVSLLTALSPPRWMLTSSGALQRSLDEGGSWDPVPVARGVSFRALSVQGAEIWVGGAAGALYHSSDLGQRWAQIIPNSNGEPLQADITRIEFESSQEGVLTTATGERWVTSDSGRSWLKK